MLSLAFTAVTKQVPDVEMLVNVNVEPETEQPDAVPLALVNVTAPVPDPPDVVNVKAVLPGPNVVESKSGDVWEMSVVVDIG